MRARIVTFTVKQDLTALVEKHARWAWILHDKDMNSETGELKDAHYHYYIEFPNSRHLSSVAKEFDIPENMVEQVRNKTGVLRYLTHSTEDSKDKYQYDISEVHSSFEMEAAVVDLDMLGIYDMIEMSSTPREAIARLTRAGYVGSQLQAINYIINIMSKLNQWERE